MKTKIQVTMPLIGKITEATILRSGRRRIKADPDTGLSPMNLKHLAKSYSIEMPEPTDEETAAGHYHKYRYRLVGGEMEKGEARLEYSTDCCATMRNWLTNLKPRIDGDSVETKRAKVISGVGVSNSLEPFVPPASVTDERT